MRDKNVVRICVLIKKHKIRMRSTRNQGIANIRKTKSWDFGALLRPNARNQEANTSEVAIIDKMHKV